MRNPIVFVVTKEPAYTLEPGDTEVVRVYGDEGAAQDYCFTKNLMSIRKWKFCDGKPMDP